MNTERMSCGEAREKLPLYVGGDLDREVLDAVRAHVEACGECARRSAQATRARRELVAAFHSAELDAAEPHLWPGIRAALKTEGLIHDADRPLVLPATASGPRRGMRRLRWGLALAPIAAAAAVLAIVQLGGFPAPESAPADVGTPPGVVAERLDPIPVQPVGGLMPVAANEDYPSLVPYERAPSRVQRVPGAAPGAPVYQVGLKFR